MGQPSPKISTYGELAVTPAMVIYITETSASIGAQNKIKFVNNSIIYQRPRGPSSMIWLLEKIIAKSGIAKTDVYILFYKNNNSSSFSLGRCSASKIFVTNSSQANCRKIYRARMRCGLTASVSFKGLKRGPSIRQQQTFQRHLAHIPSHAFQTSKQTLVSWPRADPQPCSRNLT